MAEPTFDSRGNLRLGPDTRTTSARIMVTPDAEDLNGVILDGAASSAAGNERAVIKLGDFTFGQDTAKNGTKNFGILDGSGVLTSLVESGGSVNALPFQFDIPLIVAPTGSFGDNGALTSGTANPLTYLKTYTWFPSGAIFTLSPAGWYWTVWTTTTAATVYQETWDGASAPVAVASPTAWAKTGPGAFTGPTTEAAYITLPLSALSVNALLNLVMETHQTNNANAKTVKARMTDAAGTTFATYTVTSFLHAECDMKLKVNGVADKQRITSKMITAAAVARATPALAAETTSAAFAIAITVTKGTATDVLVIESLRLTRSR